MHVAIVTFEGFNELKALIVYPAARVKSMNGVAVESRAPLSFVRAADAV